MDMSENPSRPPRLKSLRDLIRNKTRVMKEVVDTEKSYIHNMDILLNLFVDELCNSKLLTPGESRVLFGEIRSIRLVNQVLCEYFLRDDIVGAFTSLTPFLKLYSSYARNYPGSQSMLKKLMSQKLFEAFVEEQEGRPEMKGLKLPALLIMPIQRIPRYKLLLQELIKYTEDEPERIKLEGVLSEISGVTEFVNECIGDYDHTLQIIRLQQSLDSCAPKLLVPGRKLIKEGILRKRDPDDLSKCAERKFWLFNDIVMYGKRNAHRKEQYLTSCVLPLRHCSIQPVPGCNCFYLSCKGETLYLCADNYSMIDEWFHAFDQAISIARSDRLTLRKESSRRMPMKRNLLAQARRRSSSLSDKIKRRKKSRCVSPKELDTKNGFRFKFLNGFQHALSRKRKTASPVQMPPATHIKRRCTTASVKPRLSTVSEETSGLTPEIGRTCPRRTAEFSCGYRSSDPWWSQYETDDGSKSEGRSAWSTYCTIM